MNYAAELNWMTCLEKKIKNLYIEVNAYKDHAWKTQYTRKQ